MTKANGLPIAGQPVCGIVRVRTEALLDRYTDSAGYEAIGERDVDVGNRRRFGHVEDSGQDSARRNRESHVDHAAHGERLKNPRRDRIASYTSRLQAQYRSRVVCGRTRGSDVSR
jgi:hypothetical protein